MTLYQQAEYKSKIRRGKSKEAITLAMENRWEEAIAVNRFILEAFPEDIEAYNRLGKAHVELGHYDDARVAFTKALQLSPSNIIARKNLERLASVKREQQCPPKKAHKVTPQLFLEESGKSSMSRLDQYAGKKALALVAAGDAVALRIDDQKLVVETADGSYVGLVPTRLALRLIRLMRGGNRYEAAVTHATAEEMAIIVREVYQHPNQRGIASFPTRGEQPQPYSTSALLEVDMQDEEDEEREAAFSTEWEEHGEGPEGLARPTMSGKPFDAEDGEPQEEEE